MTTAWAKLSSWVLQRPGTVDLTGAAVAVSHATRQAEPCAGLTDAELRGRLADLQPGFLGSDQELGTFLAVVRELADRRVKLRPFDVQLQAAVAMLRGTSVELATGEGKTLVGALVAVGLVRAGHRVHVLAANDYLAARDATWMRPLFEAAGLHASSVTSMTPEPQRRTAYAADVVYVPVTEAGFDVLRDRLRLAPAELVGTAPDAAILDEADAVLLDEARVPLVLAGEAVEPAQAQTEVATFAASLLEDAHYEVDADRRTLHLTEEGLQQIEHRYPGVDLFGTDRDLLTRVHVALYAHALLTRDVDYLLEDGRVRLISPSRGRIDELQRWPEGLQEAVEAKEGLTPSAGVEVLDQLLIRDLVSRYQSVVGMSATLVSAAEELAELYGLRVAPLPPNRPCIREDLADRQFAARIDRDAAACAFVAAAHRRGQPVLIATPSVSESERFARILTDGGLPVALLNAKNDAEEASIIAHAGERGRVTVSTQMAGRGTDIQLDDGVAKRGGLCTLGLSRFPNRRLDDQLRGRAGRQGDPGQSVFFTSLDDDLITQLVPDHPVAQRIAADGTVTDRRLTDLADRAQRIADGQQQELRRLGRRYGLLPDVQRQEVLELRCELMTDGRAVRVLAERLPERMAQLERLLEPAVLSAAARTVLLTTLDRRWSDHLAYTMNVREGIHLRALGREEPLMEFNRSVQQAFRSLTEQAYADATAIVERAPVIDDELDLGAAGLRRPGATWTYTVTDDHFGSEWSRAGTFIARELRLRTR